MSPYSLADIKKELKQMPNNEVLDLFIEVLKLSKENKIYAAFRLFDANNEQDAQKKILLALEADVVDLTFANYWSFNKMIARIYKNLNKDTKPIKNKETLCGIYLGFATLLDERSGTLKKISHQYQRYYGFAYNKALQYLNSLHEDVQYDFKRKFDVIRHPED